MLPVKAQGVYSRHPLNGGPHPVASPIPQSRPSPRARPMPPDHIGGQASPGPDPGTRYVPGAEDPSSPGNPPYSLL